MNRAVEEQGQVSTPESPCRTAVIAPTGELWLVLTALKDQKMRCAGRRRQATLTGASLDVVMTWEVPVVPYGVWTGYDAGGQSSGNA